MKTTIRLLFAFLVFTLMCAGALLAADTPSAPTKPATDSTAVTIDTTVISVDRDAKLAELQKEYRAVNEALNASYTIEQNEMAKRLMLIEGKFEAYFSIADTTLRLKK